jgi:hypothetical protein
LIDIKNEKGEQKMNHFLNRTLSIAIILCCGFAALAQEARDSTFTIDLQSEEESNETYVNPAENLQEDIVFDLNLTHYSEHGNNRTIVSDDIEYMAHTNNCQMFRFPLQMSSSIGFQLLAGGYVNQTTRPIEVGVSEAVRPGRVPVATGFNFSVLTSEIPMTPGRVTEDVSWSTPERRERHIQSVVYTNDGYLQSVVETINSSTRTKTCRVARVRTDPNLSSVEFFEIRVAENVPFERPCETAATSPAVHYQCQQIGF